MDEQGFIFTTDATLALVVMIVFTASIVAYGLLPIYQGQNHQHLEALADSALETMDQNGIIRTAAVQYSSGDTVGAQTTLNSSLSVVIPDNVGYSFTMTLPSGDQTVTDTNGVLTSNDVATKVKVVSGPQQGWMGRAYYKEDQVQFQTINSTSVTTLWNFHNYLKNFGPWSGGLNTYNYWGGSPTNSPLYSIPVNFSVPGSPISGQFLFGTAGGGGVPSYAANVTINGNNNVILNSSFGYIYTSNGQGPIYNYQKNLSSSNLHNGLNNFFVQFINATSNQDMPWFTIIANYTTTINVPVGILNDTIPFPNIAGIGRPDTSILYSLNTGTTTPVAGRTVAWTSLQNNFAYDTSTPFELTGLPNIGIGSAIATVQDINLQPGNRLFDAFTVINAFGGEDGCIVQVMDSTGTISTVFSSFGNTARTDGGYGNVPGILNIQPYLKVGDNKVRIITWDVAPGGGYDLVGLQSCYSKITYSKFPIRWDTIPFDSYQNSSMSNYQKVTTETQSKSFTIDKDAQNAYLFVGVGTATRNMTVTITNSSGASSILYQPNQPIPYYIDLGALDAASTQTKHVMTSQVGNGSSLVPGTYSLTVSVTPSLAYQSGDGNTNPPNYGYTGDPAIFSGTRISVIYPKFLQNSWASGFANDPNTAATIAINNLVASLSDAGYSTINASLIRNTTIYAGDVPNAIPVRLDLWTQ